MTSFSPSDRRHLEEFLALLAAESGEIIRRYFRTSLSVEIKKDLSPVTVADRLTEECLRKLIEKEFPDHGILGEEFGSSSRSSRYQWVIDPIDGTKSFIHGGFDFGTMVALLEDGYPVLGMVHQPIVSDLCIGDNDSAKLNGERIRTGEHVGLKEAVLLMSEPYSVSDYQDSTGYDILVKQVKLSRSWGNCFGYTLVASGLAHIMIDPVMALWDIMAVLPIIRGAGGEVSDYQGNPPETGKSLVAATKRLHAEVIRTLALRSPSTSR